MKCDAELHIADDFGDNHATMRCELEPGHDGMHEETWRNGQCVVKWFGNDKTFDVPVLTDVVEGA